MFEKDALSSGAIAGNLMTSGLMGSGQVTSVSSMEQAKMAQGGISMGRQLPPQTNSGVDMRISRVLNGYVVHFGTPHYAGGGDVYIAADLQEVQRIILSELASRMLDEVK